SYDLPILVEGNLVGANRHAIAEYGLAVGHRDSELVVLSNLAYLVPRNSKVGPVQRRNPGQQGGKRQETDACESDAFHSKTRVRLSDASLSRPCSTFRECHTLRDRRIASTL